MFAFSRGTEEEFSLWKFLGLTTGSKLGKRTRRFNLNLTEREHRQLLAEARRSGLTPQDYTRSLLPGMTPSTISKDKAEVHKFVMSQPERIPTERELAIEKQSMESELESIENQLEIYKNMVELQNLRNELSLMELEEEKERVREKIYWKKIEGRFADALSKR